MAFFKHRRAEEDAIATMHDALALVVHEDAYERTQQQLRAERKYRQLKAALKAQLELEPENATLQQALAADFRSYHPDEVPATDPERISDYNGRL